MTFEKAGKWLLDVLFPPRCPWCDEVKAPKGNCICAQTREKLRCGAGMLNLELANQKGKFVEKAWACFQYKDSIRYGMLRFKLESEPMLALPFGEEMANTARVNNLGAAFDLMVPIPVSPKTLTQRGYNQTLLLAKEVERYTGMPCVEALQKQKETKAQRELTRQERATNIVDAFVVERPEEIAGKRILLVDDIITTGSTLNEAARILLKAGAVECGALCFASTDKPQP